MAAVLVLGVAIAAGASALVMTGAGKASPPDEVRRMVGRLARGASRGLRRLGQTWLVECLAGTPRGARLGGEVSSLAPLGRLAPDARSGLALAVVALALSSLALGAALRSPVAGVSGGIALVLGVAVRDASRERRRRRDLMAELPGVYRTLSVAMGSGQTLAQAVDYVGSHGRGAAAQAFARMSLRLRCGTGTEEAVRLMARELGAPGADMLATALVISHRTGSPLRELLLRSARLVERQGEFERLLTVRTAQVRLSIKIVCLLPVVMISLLALISPDFQRGLLTASGLTCVALAAALDGIALLIVRRIVRGVL